MNKPLLVVLPYHAGDIEQAKKLVEWIGELGSCEPHSLLLCADASAPRDKIVEIMNLARPHFVKVQTMLVAVPAPQEGKKTWPPNVMFLNAARQVKECHKFDFLWLEPDAIPMYAGWLDDISEEYYETPHRFMGSVVKQNGQEGLPSEYLNGVAVYPNDAFDVFDKIATVKDGSQAFDIGAAAILIARSTDTPIIQHYWGTKEMPPVFVESRATDAPKNHVTLDFIRKDAAIFHRSKDGKLIDILRAKRGFTKPVEKSGEGLSEVLEPKEPEKNPASEGAPTPAPTALPQPPATTPRTPAAARRT